MAGRRGRMRGNGVRHDAGGVGGGRWPGRQLGPDLLLQDLGLLGGGGGHEWRQLALGCLGCRLLLAGDGGLSRVPVGVDGARRGPGRALGHLELVAKGHEAAAGGLEAGEGMALVAQCGMDVGAAHAQIGAVGIDQRGQERRRARVDVGVDRRLGQALASGGQQLVRARQLDVDAHDLLVELLGPKPRLVELLVEHADLAPLRLELLGELLCFGLLVGGRGRRRRRRDQAAGQEDHDDRAGPP